MTKLCDDEGCPQAGAPHVCVNSDAIHKTLAEFFRSEFREDAIGVADWLAQGGQDADEFFEHLNILYPEKRIKA